MEADSSTEAKSLELQLAELMQAIGEVKETIAPINDSIKAIDTKVREDRTAVAEENYALQQQIYKNNTDLAERSAEAMAQRSLLDEQAFDLKRKLREAERMAESLQRQIDQQRRAELAQAEWATLEKRWDQLTMGAPWREWAKDHQLDGARKITYEGRMILGDTMGLGKTLTSLVALDMIEAATKDASPDNPVEFGSMK